MKTIITTAIAALAFTAMPAAAEEITKIVPLADLNLETPEGQSVLEARVDYAARMVCGEPSTMRDLKGMVAWEECKTKARTDALAQISFANSFEGIALASRF